LPPPIHIAITAALALLAPAAWAATPPTITSAFTPTARP
jgi:hypothetical protein